MSASPSKRPRDTYIEPDITPRPPRSINLEGSICSASLNVSSSKASKISRILSPIKQILYAELHQMGFRQASFATDKAPASLVALRQELKWTQDGWKILPKRLQIEVCTFLVILCIVC